MSSAPAPRTPVRTEIQALRAIAVMAVVLFHLWPQYLTGGYIGVDIFFVISGFLITGHLLREQERSGRIRLGQFWARRVRRLLPASLLVLLATVIAAWVWMPTGYWSQTLREVIASTLYVENWLLAADAVDYLAADNAASPVQHYWSLSVEEQFYLIWPLLMILALVLAGKRASGLRRQWVRVALLGSLAAISLAWSVIATATTPASAYFITPTRVWEFATGGLLAVLAPAVSARLGWSRVAVGWLAVAVLAASTLLYDAQTPFPGYTALLPVLATAAVIWSGATTQRWSVSAITAWRPIQWLGDISYSLYLWHWPLIVIAPFALRRSLDLPEKLAILVATVALAWLTKRFVEDPLRQLHALARRPAWVSFAAMLAAMAVVIAPTAVMGHELQQRTAASAQAVAELEASGAIACLGVGSAQDAAGCAGAIPDWVLLPEQAALFVDQPEIYSDRCRSQSWDPDLRICEFGVVTADRTVLLVGDSHAASYMTGLDAAAKSLGWRLETAFKGGCPWIDDPGAGDRSCIEWNATVRDYITDPQHRPDVIVTSFRTTFSWGFADEEAHASGIAAKVRDYWQQFADLGIQLVIVDDAPRQKQDAVDCVISAQTTAEVKACGTSRSYALAGADILAEVASAVGATFVPIRSLICDAETCPMVIGGVIAYRDSSSHFTETFSRTLGPIFTEALRASTAG